MKKIYFIMGISSLIAMNSCLAQKPENSKSQNIELLEFAKVNCMFWYFKKKNYSTKDISAISGGIVELGSLSAEKYRKISFIVKKYKPKITTKQNIDIDLLKCFKIESDKIFLSKISSIK